MDTQVSLSPTFDLSAYNGQTIVVKIGGELVTDDYLPVIAAQLKTLQKAGAHIVLVHGGGKQITDACIARKLTVTMKDGIRVTDADTMEVMKGIMPDISAEVTTALEEAGCAVFSASTYGHGFVYGKAINPNDPANFTGKPTTVRTVELIPLLNKGSLVVLSCLGMTSDGQALNINADDVATAVAVQMKASRLLLTTISGGVLDDKNRPFSQLTPALIEDYINAGTITDGMVPKVQNAAAALGDVGGVAILGYDKLLDELGTSLGGGTLITPYASLTVQPITDPKFLNDVRSLHAKTSNLVPKPPEYFPDLIGSKTGVLFGAFDSGRLLGTVAVVTAPSFKDAASECLQHVNCTTPVLMDYKGSVATIQSLAGGNGIAKALVTAAKKWILEQDIHHCFAQSGTENTGAERTFTAHGFAVVATNAGMKKVLYGIHL